MRTLLSLAALACVLAAPVRADEAADCDSGIAMIKVELAKTPKQPVLGQLQKALRVAEREKGEREFDECLDAVGDARKALGRR